MKSKLRKSRHGYCAETNPDWHLHLRLVTPWNAQYPSTWFFRNNSSRGAGHTAYTMMMLSFVPMITLLIKLCDLICSFMMKVVSLFFKTEYDPTQSPRLGQNRVHVSSHLSRWQCTIHSLEFVYENVEIRGEKWI
jgi:hypothetical protein